MTNLNYENLMIIEPRYCFRCQFFKYVSNVGILPCYKCSQIGIVVTQFNTCCNFEKKIKKNKLKAGDDY